MDMNRNVYLSILFLLSISFWASSQAIPANIVMDSLNIEKGNIQYPSDWLLDQSGLMGTRFILFMPEDSLNDFRENINLVSQPLGSSIPGLEAIAEATIAQLKMFITDYEQIHSGLKQDYYEMEYTGKQGQFDLHWNQRLYTKGEELYVLTFTGTREDYSKMINDALKVMDSYVTE